MNKIVKFSLIFGLLAGVLYFAFFLMMYAFIDNPLYDKASPLGLQMIIVLFAIWYFKRKQNTYLHFYEGFSIGVLSNFLAALISGVLIWAFLQFIDIRPFDTWISESVNFLMKDRADKKDLMSDETFQNMITSIQNSKPSTLILDRIIASFWLVFPIGLFTMVLRKIRPAG